MGSGRGSHPGVYHAARPSGPRPCPAGVAQGHLRSKVIVLRARWGWAGVPKCSLIFLGPHFLYQKIQRFKQKAHSYRNWAFAESSCLSFRTHCCCFSNSPQEGFYEPGNRKSNVAFVKSPGTAGKHL